MEQQVEAMQAVKQVAKEAEEAFSQVDDLKSLDVFRVQYLGRKGPVISLMQKLRGIPKEERPAFGQEVNRLKETLEGKVQARYEELLAETETAQIAEETIDITLPGRRRHRGGKHVLTQMMDRVIAILSSMGFTAQDGPHIESEYYNFEVLNMDEDHPARDMQDTFYLSPGKLLRTHTSSIQAHEMERSTPPIRIICPGRAFRNEAVSARSHVLFHQVEGLYIDEGVTFSDLLVTLEDFLARLFEQKVETRFRCSYFPFVEPGLEVDIACISCGGKGCSICKKTGWLEIGGAGMVHPKVLENGGIDPERYSGFAWGVGIDRLVMLREGIPDIRLFTENRLEFLEQFS